MDRLILSLIQDKGKIMNTSFSLTYWRDVLLTALAPAIWGSTYIVTTQFLPPDRPFTAALIRVLPAGILLLLIARRFPAYRDTGRLLILSALNIGAFQALLFIAAYRLPGGLAAVIGAIQPLFSDGTRLGCRSSRTTTNYLMGSAVRITRHDRIIAFSPYGI